MTNNVLLVQHFEICYAAVVFTSTAFTYYQMNYMSYVIVCNIR